MFSQSVLIGDHPQAPEQFARWLTCNDVVLTATKCHRSLTGNIATDDDELVEWLARNLINHHYSDFRLQQLREKFGQLGFPQYAEQNRKFPRADKTKKGNATEVLLVEYVSKSLRKDLLKVFKLKYNPNVDQAIKGDDTLMVDLINVDGVDKIKVYLGESKFRSTPSKAVVDEIMKSLSKDKKPLSYSFLVDELGKNPDTIELAKRLDEFIIDEIKANGDLVYTGLLLSNTNTFNIVEQNLNSDNPNLVLISIGVDNPTLLIEKAFEKAEELLMEGQI